MTSVNTKGKDARYDDDIEPFENFGSIDDLKKHSQESILTND